MMKCNFVVCIPVYNNPKTIVEVMKACLSAVKHPLIVVDDGSDEGVEQLAKNSSLTAKDLSRIFFLRHEVNCGKGIALQTGFEFAISQGFTHLIAIDGDGQHLASDIPALAASAVENPWALIVGDRNMQTANVPESSTFGKKFSNFWVRYQTNTNVADSQSGFRVYPLFYIQTMKFFCTKYDFEIEILIRLIWKGVPIKNVKISVLYFPKEKRVSHFHKFRDNLRITILNTGLTIASLVREQTSPFKSSLALGIGVFVGTLPIYGLHTGIVAALAFLLRLNFVYLWVGTNISIPPMIPFLLLASQAIGELFVQTTENSFAGFGLAVLMGAPILGLLLGVTAFALLYQTKTMFIRKKSKNVWTGRNSNRLGIAFVRAVLKTLGMKAAYFCLYFIVFYYFLFSFRTRKSLNEFWKVVRPEMRWLPRQIRMYSQVLVFAKTLVDRGFQRESKKVLFQYDYDITSHELLSHFQGGKDGAMVVASHVGGWDLAMAFFSTVPTDKKIMVVMHGIARQYGQLESGDGKSKSNVIFSDLDQGSLVKIKNHFAAREVVGMMADRPLTQSLELKLFFGKLAAFDTGPFRIALACQVSVYFIFSVKVARLKYKVFTFKGEANPSASKAEQVDQLLRQYVSHLEKIVDRYPEQWFNFFPFWSEVPGPVSGLGVSLASE